MAAKLGRAVQTTSHEEALVLINGALELDPQNEEARRSFEIRSAALVASGLALPPRRRGVCLPQAHMSRL